MKRKLLLAAVLAVGAVGMRAQTDVTSSITNANFSSTTGWTDAHEGSTYDLGNGFIGTYQIQSNAATIDANHLATDYCLGFRASWGTTKSSYTQTVSLPAGAYALSFDVENVNGSTTSSSYKNLFYVEIGGKQTMDTYTEWMKGRSSWTTHTINFTLTAQTNTTISFGYGSNSISTGNSPYLFVSNLKLTCSPFATSDDYSALNTAMSAIEGINWGFDEGEYAPYKYADVLEALATAKAIDQEANNSQTTVQALTATLNTSLTANTAEVNAIWDPSFEHEYSTSGNVQPIAWTGTSGHDNATDVRWMWNVSSNAGLAATSSSKALFTKYGVFYGQQTGYTLPLNASTYYTLSFKYGGWSDCKKDGYVTMSDPASTSLSLIPSDRLPLDAVDGNSNSESWKNYSTIFKTNDAGNYILGLRKDKESQQSQYVYGDFVLKTTTVDEATTYYNTVKAAVESDYDADAHGGAEKTAFKAAIGASVPNTVNEIMEAAANLYTLRDAFLAAVSEYEKLYTEITAATAIDKTTNVGEDVFQTPASAVTEINEAIDIAQSVYDNSSATSSEVSDAIDALKAAEEKYINTLNAPTADKKYYIKVATSEHAKLNNAWLLTSGTTSGNNPTGYTIQANNAPAAYLSQAFTFTQVSGNSYKISIDLNGTPVYLTNGTNNSSAAEWKASQIQGTIDESKAMAFKITVSSTAGAFKIYNTETNSTIACQNGGNIYTEAGNADFSVAEASQAEVTASAKAGKYGTVIFPFTPDVSTGFDDITFYSCASVENNYVQMEEVATPAANTPYIIKNNGESNFSKTLTGWGAAAAESYTAGLLTGVYTGSTVPTSSYVLQTQNDTQAFYVVEEEFTATAYKAYLTKPSSAKAFYFNIENANAIEAISALTSDNIESIYTVSGAKVNSLQKGINIVKMQNGETKKVFVK